MARPNSGENITAPTEESPSFLKSSEYIEILLLIREIENSYESLLRISAKEIEQFFFPFLLALL